jgi:hypothetical protein
MWVSLPDDLGSFVRLHFNFHIHDDGGFVVVVKNKALFVGRQQLGDGARRHF